MDARREEGQEAYEAELKKQADAKAKEEARIARLSPEKRNAEAEAEKKILDEANSLGIGPMGLGGRTTLLGVKIASRPRVPASFFVTVAYMCWACRRRSMRI